MKILMLTPYLPFPLLSGGQIRTYNLLKKLAKKHEITLFALIKDNKEKEYIPEIAKYCKKVKVFKRSSKPFTLSNIIKTAFSSFPFLAIRNHAPKAIQAVKKELSSNIYDLIHAETFYMMPHLPETKIPTILVEQTIEYLGYESYAKKANPLLKQLLKLDIKKIKYWEKHYWHKCDKLIVMSDDDRNFILKLFQMPDKIEVVSNGVDTNWFKQIKRSEGKDPVALYVGTFKWLPNIEAVDFLVNKVWPILKKQITNISLRIVGNNPTNSILNYGKKDDSIDVVGRVEDIRDAFTSAHVLIAPVFSGRGTRYKILEAMASGTPVVGTSIAVEGLGVKHGDQVLIGDTAIEISKLTKKVLSDKKLWNKLAENGKKFVEDHYDWSLISKKLDIIYKDLGS